MFIFAVFGLIPVVQANSTPLFSPVIIKYDQSDEVEKSVSALQTVIPRSTIIEYKDAFSVFSAMILMRSYDVIILVGHGTENGIQGPSGEVSWQETANWVNKLPVREVYFLSCNSNAATDLVTKDSMGFEGNVDGPLAAFRIGVDYNFKKYDIEATYNSLSKLVKRIIGLSGGDPSESMVEEECMCGGGGSTPPSPTYVVTFTALGLPTGATWSVTFNGQLYTTTNSHIYIYPVTAGTYSYSVGGISGYVAAPSSGSLPVSDHTTLPIVYAVPPPPPPAPGLSTSELTYWMLMTYITSLLILLNFVVYPEWNFAQTTAMNLVAAGWKGIVISFSYLQTGQATLEGILGIVVGFVNSALGYLVSAALAADPIAFLAFITSAMAAIMALVLEAVGSSMTAGGVTMVKWLAGSAMILALAAGIYSDLIDSNDVVG